MRKSGFIPAITALIRSSVTKFLKILNNDWDSRVLNYRGHRWVDISKSSVLGSCFHGAFNIGNSVMSYELSMTPAINFRFFIFVFCVHEYSHNPRMYKKWRIKKMLSFPRYEMLPFWNNWIVYSHFNFQCSCNSCKSCCREILNNLWDLSAESSKFWSICKKMNFFLLACLLLSYVSTLHAEHVQCPDWAESGECENSKWSGCGLHMFSIPITC